MVSGHVRHNYLKGKFPKSIIEVEDVSNSGYCSIHDIQLWDDYLGKTMPDLMLVGWDMNDHDLPDVGGVEPEAFLKNLTTLVQMIRDRKNAEVILFPALPPNDAWHFGTHRTGLFADATRQAAIDSKFINMYIFNSWQAVLKRKDQSSLLGNNINRPNDFGHWLYEQAFEAMTL